MRGLDKQQLRAVDQELKEAICNALVNLTIERVNGSGDIGKYVYGFSPRRSIVSGQLLPRFDQAQEDETSDIHIAAIGIDFQVDANATGEASATPDFSVYVRVLPDWNELRDENLHLDIDFKLKPDVQSAIDARMRDLKQQRFGAAGVATPQWAKLTPHQKLEVKSTRETISREVLQQAYGEHNIRLYAEDTTLPPSAETPAPSSDGSSQDEEQEVRLQIGRLLQRGREIPFNLLESSDIPAKWRRIPIALPTFRWQLSLAVEALKEEAAAYSVQLRAETERQVHAWLDSSEGRRDAWRDGQIRPEDIATPEAWAAFRSRLELMPVPYALLLPKLDEVALQVDRATDYVDNSRAAVRVVLDNRTAELGRRAAKTRSDTLFQVRLTVRFPNADHRPLKLDRVEASYRFRHFLNYDAIGLNCGITSSLVTSDIVLATTWAPRFIQPRIVPRKIDVPITFDVLSKPSLDVKELYALPTAYKSWIEGEANRLQKVVGEGLSEVDATLERKRLELDTAAQLLEVHYIKRGVDLLQEAQDAWRKLAIEQDANRRPELELLAAPYRAWILTNESFFRRDGLDKDRGWHLFQLGFILAHIPTLASRMEIYRAYQSPELDEQSASLLYFPTGGGKSEAFYGVLLYGMFLDRLRGKQRGVTAMIRYPLRLLTLQQGQRLLKLIAHAEIVRTVQKVGTWPFEIGFWVGGTNTPNRYVAVPSAVPASDNEQFLTDADLEENVAGRTPEEKRDSQKYRDFRSAYNKVPECPVCGSATVLRRHIKDGPTAARLGIYCSNPDCQYAKTVGDRVPLPFLLTDDTIYQRAPSVVLGTIDKMALLGQNPSTIRQLLGMFGLARGIGPTGHLDSPRVEGDLAATLANLGYREVFPTFKRGVRVLL